MLALAFGFAVLTSVEAYTWPNYLVDEMEHLLVDSQGYNSAGLFEDITPCSYYAYEPHYGTGRQTAAQWLRVSFHDFSTADIVAGTGGLDASIAWETDRPENSGQAMNDTIGNFAPFISKYTSMSDMIALGVVAASAACSGPSLSYKGGRVDALEAGPYGVPEPDTDIKTTLTRFAATGFDQAGAIQLTACGHTIGSVHHAGFPNIVGPSAVTPNNTQGGIAMDDTEDVFDNHIASEYISGTTPNPLVSSFNEIVRSDYRLFVSDGNATMKDLASSSQETWDVVCNKVFTQMINTVPNGVSLQDITPQAVKPVGIQLDMDSTGNMIFKGAIRLLGTTFTSSSNPTVSISWTSAADSKHYSIPAYFNGSTGTSVILNTDTYYHLFSTPIDSRAGIKSFTITVNDGPSRKTYDNAGNGYPVQDSVIYLTHMSNFSITSNAKNVSAVDLNAHVAAAVRSSMPLTNVSAVFSVPTPQIGTLSPKLVTVTVPLASSTALGFSGYTLYTGSTPLGQGLDPNGRALPLAAYNGTTFDVVAAMKDGSSIVDENRKIATVVQI